MNKWLLLFTFSPVQSFIAQGRKTQDVYAGSYILSHLCGVALKKAKNDFHAEIIFPIVKDESRPNRFLAIIENDRESLQRIGQSLEKSVTGEFLSIGDTILDNLGYPEGALKRAYQDQLRSYLQVFWLFEKIEENNYAKAYQSIEEKLGTLKNIRPYGQLSETGSRKCSLTGEHNVLLFRGKKKAYVVPPAVPIKLSQASLKFLKEGENLGAVGSIKRFAELYFNEAEYPSFKTDFPSTAELALFATMGQLKKIDPALAGKITAKGSNFDYQAIFDRKNNKPIPSDLKEIVNRAYEIIEMKKIPLCPYYAVLVFDGDDMGKVLSGERLKDGANLKELHLKLTEALGSFAGATRAIVQKPKGEIVYAGGEDFMAFISLQHLFSILSELRTRFDAINLDDYLNEKLTFSAGVAVAHYKTPLNEVLKWAKKIEQEAKRIDGIKNALGIAVLKHSGGVEKAVYRWQGENTRKWITELMQCLLEHLDDKFSDTFIRSLQLEFRKLLDCDGKRIICDSVLLAINSQKITFEEDMIEAELKRLIICACKLGETGNKNNRTEAINGLFSILKHFFDERLLDINNFFSMLNIINFIERQVNSQ